MKDLLNCPNCGAPIKGSKCEYCGTMFSDDFGQKNAYFLDPEFLDLEMRMLNSQLRASIVEASQASQTNIILNSLNTGLFSYNDARQSIQASLNDLNKTQYQNIRDSLNTCRSETIISGSTIYDESGNSMTGSHIFPQTKLTFWQKVKNWWNMNEMKTLDFVLIILALLFVSFTTIMLITFWRYGTLFGEYGYLFGF